MSKTLRTRNAKVGREPKMRDKILNIIKDSNSAWTMREIAGELGVGTTTPYRALQTLKRMNLVKTGESIDGKVFYTNEKAYEKLKEKAAEDDRYVSLEQ